MNGEANHIKSYTAEDFQRYHNGTMSSAERHALEKAALEDPFLADALEGYAATQNAQEDLQEIHVRLDARIGKQANKRKAVIKMISIAALLLIMAGAGVFMFKTTIKPENKVALTKPKQTEEKATSISKVPDIPLNTATADSSVALSKPTQNINLFKTNEEGKKSTKRTSVPKDEVAIVEEKSLSKQGALSQETTLTPYAASAPRSFIQKESKVGVGDTVVENIFKGRVVDKEGNSILGATVAGRDQNISTVTDSSGYFTLRSKDSALNATVSYIGYLPVHIQLREMANSQKVTLIQGSQPLSEVVVTGYGSKKAKSANKKVERSIKPEPEGGWEQFDNYINTKLKEKEALYNSFPTGEAILSFEIDKNGEPFNIKVEQSLCDKCDEEAIRLLKEGPKWKKNNKKGEVKIRFKN